MQTMTEEGRKRLIAREGKRNVAYQDTKGIWTIGVGHTAAAGPPTVTRGLTITDADVDAILARDLGQYEKAVRDSITVPLADNQFDALVSICFNIGVPGFRGSTIVRRINAKANASEIRAAILMWNKPTEIIGRRTSEADQFQWPYSLGSSVAPSKASPGPIPPKTANPAPEPSEAIQRGPGIFNTLIDRLRTAFPEKTN